MSTTPEPLLLQHREALAAVCGECPHVTAADLHRPTPCGAWDVADLLAHLLGQHRGLTAAAGGSEDPTAWCPVPLDADGPAGAPVAASAAALLTALEGASGELWMPEVRPDAPLPVPTAVRVHLFDCVVHAWDLARALGRPDPHVGGAVLDVAEAVAAHLRPGPAFGIPLTTTSSRRLDRLLARSGRDPGWPGAPRRGTPTGSSRGPRGTAG